MVDLMMGLTIMDFEVASCPLIIQDDDDKVIEGERR